MKQLKFLRAWLVMLCLVLGTGVMWGEDYKLVESALDDWRGKYLIAYSDNVFMDGSLAGGTSGVGKAQSHVDPSSSLSSDKKTISGTWGDQHYVIIEAIDDNDLSKGYVIKSHSATTPYFYQTSNANGMACNANKLTAATYPITVNFVSSSDIQLKLGGSATGAILHYNANSGSSGEMFRYYKNGGQKAIYLYKQTNSSGIVSKKDATIFKKTLFSFEAGAIGELAELVNVPTDYDGTITYGSYDDDVFTIDASGYLAGDGGSTKIFATANATATYNEIYEEVDVTVAPLKYITALEVSGFPAKIIYNVGDIFETAGLVVTATYSDESTVEITEGFEWEIDYGNGNEAFVAGATSVDVMAHIDDIMSEVYTVNGLTVNVPVTLTSIAVSGTPTKTEYYAGDTFDTAGLVVTGSYSDSTTAPITEGIEWTVDPETLAEGTTSVNVTAGVGSVVSEVYTVNGLTVTENPYKTATVTSFSSTSGDINADIAYEAFKGNASTDPAVYNSKLRLYQNGGYVTVTAATGLKIASVKITTSETYASTTVGYCVDDEDAPTTGETVAKNSDYVINGLNNNSVSIYCLGADKNTRLEIAAIEVTYSGNLVTELKTIKLTGTYPTEFTEGDEFSHEGMTVTATYTDDTEKDVTASATFTGYDMNTLGEQIVTVSYTEDNLTKTATYAITVNKAPFVPSPAVYGYEVVDFTTIEPYKSLATNGSADMATYEGTSFAMSFAKPESSSTPTKYYKNGNAVRAYTGNTIAITAAEPIFDIDIDWVEGYVDDKVRFIGLGTSLVTIEITKTCRFTAITVYYKGVELVAQNDEKTSYYATFSSDKDVEFVDAEVYTVTVSEGKISLHEVSDKQVPAGNGVLIKTPEARAPYKYVEAESSLDDNMLVPCKETGIYDANDNDNLYYKLAYGDNVNKRKLGFYWGAEDGSGNFNVKKGLAILQVPKSGATMTTMGFSFDGQSDTNAIEMVESENNNDVIYNLQGIRLNSLQKGINIVNGRKVIR